MKKVFILEEGSYEDKQVSAVYVGEDPESTEELFVLYRDAFPKKFAHLWEEGSTKRYFSWTRFSDEMDYDHYIAWVKETYKLQKVPFAII